MLFIIIYLIIGAILTTRIVMSNPKKYERFTLMEKIRGNLLGFVITPICLILGVIVGIIDSFKGES